LNSNCTSGQSYLFSSSFSLILTILAGSFILFFTLAFALIFSLRLRLLLLPLALALTLIPLSTIFVIPALVASISSIHLFSSLPISLLATKP